MIRLLLLLIAASAFANPFHKYPYVFLLDIGNEELEKVNTEQIRVSKQGGSLALRYPAIGNGDDIAHVRVSGIDFGTDLKADIVDGGPGYKYVVLVLMGNQGVDFDAVITIQTVPPNVDEKLQTDSSKVSNYQSSENEVNNSAEDSDDNQEIGESGEASQITIEKNAELTQESSNVYNYAINEALNGYGNSIHSSQSDYAVENDENDANEDTNNANEDTNDANEDTNDQSIKYVKYIDKPETQFDEENNGYALSLKQNAQDQINNYESNSGIDDQSYAFDNRNRQEYLRNDVYQAGPYTVGRVEDFPQSAGSDTVYIEEPDSEGLNLEEILNDDYEEDDDYPRKGDKNNFIDRSDKSAVAY